MLKKTINFTDIDGNKVTEDFYFKVDRADLIELMIDKPEMEEKLQTMTTNMDGRSIIGILREFILVSVGKRPPGTREFVKTKEVLSDFRYSGAYDALLWELTNDPKQANDFLESIFPASLLEEIKLRGGNFDDIRKQVADGKPLNEVVAQLPDKDWAANPVASHPLAEGREAEIKNPQSFVELATPGTTIDTVEGEVVADPRSTFPSSLPEAVAATRTINQDSSDDRPAWLRELREPTNKELLEMNKGEMALAFRLREEGKLNVQNK